MRLFSWDLLSGNLHVLTFTLLAAFPLRHSGECGLMGLTPDKQLYVEEVYGQGWAAQAVLAETGQVLVAVDEAEGRSELNPLPLPEDLITPVAPAHTLALNYAGARYRGLRELERLADLVQPLTRSEKMALIERLSLKIPPLLLAGVAESRVLSEAVLNADGLYLVCRRVRLAVLLPEIRYDGDKQPYDYDTLTLHVAHVYDPHHDIAPPLAEALNGIGGVRLHRPLECLVYQDRLYLADGGNLHASIKSRICIWQIEHG